MSNSISRSMLDALLPPGPIWVPKDGGGFDLLLEGVADSTETMREFLDSLSETRSPANTTILSDLEKEFGIIFNSSLTESERRAQLLAAKTGNNGDGTATFLQNKLTQAGFNVQVHVNDPPIDPGIIMSDTFQTYMGNTTAVCGNDLAFHGRQSGLLLVNGDEIFDTFLVPTDPDTWPMIFFVGGDATRDGTTNELLSIEAADVAASRKDELARMIVGIKPLHTWCGQIVSFV